MTHEPRFEASSEQSERGKLRLTEPRSVLVPTLPLCVSAPVQPTDLN